VADGRWTGAIGYFHDLAYICAPSPFQHAAAAGLNELKPDFYRELGEDYARKRKLLCNALRKAGLEPSEPQGSYYVLADASALPGRASKEKAMFLLAETGVAAVPGAAFYHGGGGEQLLRFCFAKTDADLEEGCRRLAKLRVTAAAAR
jgi:aminotransferase